VGGVGLREARAGDAVGDQPPVLGRGRLVVAAGDDERGSPHGADHPALVHVAQAAQAA
jgi:hypothetical protein